MRISSAITLLTPLRNQLELQITQAPGGDFRHDGDLYYGWDFAAASGPLRGEQVLAVADGTVRFVEESVPGDDAVSGSDGSDGATRDPSLGPPVALGNVVTAKRTVDGLIHRTCRPQPRHELLLRDAGTLTIPGGGLNFSPKEALTWQ